MAGRGRQRERERERGGGCRGGGASRGTRGEGSVRVVMGGCGFGLELEVLGENMSTFMDISLYTTHPF